MKKFKISCIATLSILLSLCGCKGPYGDKIEENLEATNIVEDNYRNYYEIFVHSYRDSNGDGIGDLQGIIEKLDYIKDLGFNGIWLMPIHPSPTYHKYDVKNYYDVDPKYGSMEDLEELIDECHERNIKLIIDMVLNHSSAYNEWYSKSIDAYNNYLLGKQLTEEEEKFKDFYKFYPDKESVPGSIKAYEVGSRGFYVEANFDKAMPEFNCDSPYVKQEFKNILKFYLDKGIDGFRFDAVKYYYLNNDVKNIAFLKELSDYAKSVNENCYLIGENWSANQSIRQYYEGSGFDSFFDFSASVSNPSGYIMNSINRFGSALTMYYNGMVESIDMACGQIPAPFISNHDLSRFTPSIEDLADTKFQYALLSMLNGSTFTYYGDEIGMVGSNASGNPDQNVRTPMRWGEGDNGRYGDAHIISGTTQSKNPHGNVKTQMEDPNSLYHFYKKCLLIRNQNPEIARGEVEKLVLEKDQEQIKELFIAKTYKGSRIGIVFNFSPLYDLDVNYKEHGFSKVVGQIVVDASDTKYVGKNGDNIKLPPYSIAIVK